MSQLITGISFPIRFDAQGHLARSSGATKLLDNIRLLASTAYNQRIMRPEFGTSAEQILFKKIDPLDLVQLKQDIVSAINRYERRVTVVSVEATNTQDTTIQIMIRYSIKGLGYQPIVTESFTL